MAFDLGVVVGTVFWCLEMVVAGLLQVGSISKHGAEGALSQGGRGGGVGGWLRPSFIYRRVYVK